MNDPIADMIIRMKNASDLKKESVVFPCSKIKTEILETLLKEKFVESYKINGKGAIRFIEVKLSYDESGNPMINGVQRVSKTSRRVYQKSKDIRPVKNGFGVLIISTPKGIVTGKFAKENNLGGEALFKVW